MATESIPKPKEVQSCLGALLPALQRLDRLLEKAIAAANDAYGPGAAVDRYRGLYIGPDQVDRLLARQPGAPLFHLDREAEGDEEDASRLAWLMRAYDLSPFDLDLILIGLAPELDLRYERLYAYLQDDVTRKLPTVDLALNLLSTSAEEKLSRRSHFASESPLIRHGLLHLIPDPNQVHPPLLGHYLKLDEQIVRLLLGLEGLDPRLATFCKLIEPAASLDELPLSAELKRSLPRIVRRAREERRPLRLYFHGPRGTGKRRTAEVLAEEVGMGLLAVDLAHASPGRVDFTQDLTLVFREAWFKDTLLYLDGVDLLREERATAFQTLIDLLGQDEGIAILAGTKGWVPQGHGPLGVISLAFSAPDFEQRLACWQAGLEAEGITLKANELYALTDRFRLTPRQMADAAATARNQSVWRAAGLGANDSEGLSDATAAVTDLFATARAQCGHELAALTRKVKPIYAWSDIVLPDDSIAQLREICQRVTHRERVFGEWGFDRKLSLGKGVNALFAGPSGTGKTMAAEIIANELALDLYKVELSGVVSKYIGETEKNLDQIFTAAEDSNAILFFDEADALFGRRSEVHDSHDRYANIEISYLLQKMEQYEGIAVLATNLRSSLDESFLRRLTFTVHFPFPDEASRRLIWTGIWPREMPLASDVDLEYISNRFKLSGGNIKNIALSAAFLAIPDGGSVAMRHLLLATRREYQKFGKSISEAELSGLFSDALSGAAESVR
jgi:ATP-dependent 26S proteasome regulatory subunit